MGGIAENYIRVPQKEEKKRNWFLVKRWVFLIEYYSLRAMRLSLGVASIEELIVLYIIYLIIFFFFSPFFINIVLFS